MQDTPLAGRGQSSRSRGRPKGSGSGSKGGTGKGRSRKSIAGSAAAMAGAKAGAAAASAAAYAAYGYNVSKGTWGRGGSRLRRAEPATWVWVVILYSLSKNRLSIVGIACPLHSEIQAIHSVTWWWCERIASSTADDRERLALQKFRMPFELPHTKYFSSFLFFTLVSR